MNASPQNSRHLTFRDPRPPQEMAAALEREMMVPLKPGVEAGQLSYQGAFKVTGALGHAVLFFVRTSGKWYDYALTLSMSWETMPADSWDYFRRSSEGWFDLWTREIRSSPVPETAEGNKEAREKKIREALQAEEKLITLTAVKEDILERMRRGAWFSNAHKEGGSVIRYAAGRFHRSDYGESPAQQTYPDTESFLTFLRQFHDWETSRNVADSLPELDRWRLIRRCLREDTDGPPLLVKPGPAWMPGVVAFAVAFVVVGGLAWLRGGPFHFHRFSHQPAAEQTVIPVPPGGFRPPAMQVPGQPPAKIRPGASDAKTSLEH
jgi:hypothetical protein